MVKNINATVIDMNNTHDVDNLQDRKLNALTIKKQAMTYLISGELGHELHEKIQNLKMQDSNISTMSALEILLDFVEREFRVLK